MHSVEDQFATIKKKFAGFDETSVGTGSWTVPTYDLDGTLGPAAIPAGIFIGSTSFNFGANASKPAGKDVKPSWGFGGKAPESYDVARSASESFSLVS